MLTILFRSIQEIKGHFLTAEFPRYENELVQKIHIVFGMNSTISKAKCYRKTPMGKPGYTSILKEHRPANTHILQNEAIENLYQP